MLALNLFIKRSFDIIVSSLAIVFFTVFPVFIVIPILLKLTAKGPVFFKQVRIGKDKRPFVMYKFRTMIVEQYNAEGKEIMSEDRITKTGRFLRKTSLDELPQLFNVLNGTMSIVGPRPPLPREVVQYTPYQMHRLDVITGLACYHECQGRSDSKDFDSWYEKRTAADGKIDFHGRTRDIYNLIRGVAAPFPGAYAFADEDKVIIWEAQPFDEMIDFSKYAPGEVIDVFDGHPIVRTVDGSLLIKKYEAERVLQQGNILK